MSAKQKPARKKYTRRYVYVGDDQSCTNKYGEKYVQGKLTYKRKGKDVTIGKNWNPKPRLRCRQSRKSSRKNNKKLSAGQRKKSKPKKFGPVRRRHYVYNGDARGCSDKYGDRYVQGSLSYDRKGKQIKIGQRWSPKARLSCRLFRHKKKRSIQGRNTHKKLSAGRRRRRRRSSRRRRR